jgi:hypothetical protein
VIRFAFALARERQPSGDKLSELAQRMAEAKDPAEVQKIREDIPHGFTANRRYGRSKICATANRYEVRCK